MKKMILAAGVAFLFAGASAQQISELGESYIVKTKNAVKKTQTADPLQDSTEGKSSRDFLSENFQFLSLCDWTPGMRFMVLPERYDLIVKTFHEESSRLEVSSMSLRYKIMEYRGHSNNGEGRERINFKCIDNGKNYYYEIPSGSFEDYCYGKLGVPTLAYLGDVDKARELLEGKTLYTKGKIYRVDTGSESEGYREIKVDDYEEVVVKRIGVGTRSFPVKIIMADKDSMEYYQNVAMSKINSGMRDDEFIMDSVKHTFYGAFEMQDAMMEIYRDINDYVGKTIHTKFVTEMNTRGDGKDRVVKVPKMTSFTVEALRALPEKHPYFMLTLKEAESRREYFKNVTFDYLKDFSDPADSKKLEYFGYLFAMGEGKQRQTDAAGRAAIREGRVIRGMSTDEVTLAMGEEPVETSNRKDGGFDWVYHRSTKDFVIHFGRNGIVDTYETRAAKRPSTTTGKKKTVSKGKGKTTTKRRK